MSRFWGVTTGHLRSPLWVPHTTEVLQEGVFGSRWQLGDGHGNWTNTTLWTLINHAGRNLSGPQLGIQLAHTATTRFYDCYHGEELQPNGGRSALRASPHVQATLGFELEAGGFGCVVMYDTQTEELQAEMMRMAAMTRQPLSSLDSTWTVLKQTAVVETSPRARSPPARMVLIPRATNWRFVSEGIEAESSEPGMDVQFPWERGPATRHDFRVDIAPFYIDYYPVTCRQYGMYLVATGYTPNATLNWLRNWGGSRSPPAALLDVPVTWISLKEARLYCKWVGGRVPQAWEWQLAAQGSSANYVRKCFPWGSCAAESFDNPTSCFPCYNASNEPTCHSGSAAVNPEPVGNHSPAGDSPYGVGDMVGNVLQFTTEFRDEHTRRVLLKGSANYFPASGWYLQYPAFVWMHQEYFLFDDTYERASTIGFRCAVDAHE